MKQFTGDRLQAGYSHHIGGDGAVKMVSRSGPEGGDTFRQTEAFQDLRRGLLDGERLVARRAVLRDGRAVGGHVLLVMASEAPGEVGVPQVFGYVPHVTFKSGKTFLSQMAMSAAPARFTSPERCASTSG